MSALGGIYTTGTISVAANGTTVTGVGTAWALGNTIRSGDTFFANGAIGLIDTVTDNTHFTLVLPWTGGNLSGAAYVIKKDSWERYDPALTQKTTGDLAAALADNAIIFAVAAGGTPDPSLGDEGQYALDFQNGKWWKKTGGVWTGPNLLNQSPDADYLVKTANAGLTAERVVTDNNAAGGVVADWSVAGQVKFKGYASGADKYRYSTGANAWAEAAITSQARGVLASTNIAVSGANTGFGINTPSQTVEMYRAPSDTPGSGSLGFSYLTTGDAALWTFRLSGAAEYDLNLDRRASGVWANVLTIDRGLGNIGVATGANPPAKIFVGSVFRYSGTGSNDLAAVVAAGPTSDSVSLLDSSSVPVLEVRGTDASSNMKFGIGAASYSYNPWIQCAYDNGGGGSGAKHLLLQPIGGNVGVGVPEAPYATFEVRKTASGALGPTLLLSNLDSNTNAAVNFDAGLSASAGAVLARFQAVRTNRSGTTADWVWYNYTGGALTEAARLRDDGRFTTKTLVVGTGSDAAASDSTIATFTSNGPTNVAIRDSTNDVETLNYVYSGGGIGGTYTNHAYVIRTANADRITVAAAGTVTVTAQLAVSYATTVPLVVTNNLANCHITVSDDNNAHNANFGSINGGNAYIYTVGYAAVYTGGIERQRWSPGGTLSLGWAGTGACTVDIVGSFALRAGSSITLANGLNSNISTPTAAYARLAGPTGAFSVGGLSGGSDGRVIVLYNTVAQTMTIVNEDASSTAGNRIKTLTGGNIVLRATATSSVTLHYDATDARWIVTAYN